MTSPPTRQQGLCHGGRCGGRWSLRGMGRPAIVQYLGGTGVCSKAASPQRATIPYAFLLGFVAVGRQSAPRVVTCWLRHRSWRPTHSRRMAAIASAANAAPTDPQLECAARSDQRRQALDMKHAPWPGLSVLDSYQERWERSHLSRPRCHRQQDVIVSYCCSLYRSGQPSKQNQTTRKGHGHQANQDVATRNISKRHDSI